MSTTMDGASELLPLITASTVTESTARTLEVRDG